MVKGKVSELIANVMTGTSAGLTFRYTGGVGKSLGNLLLAVLSADCTSCSTTPSSALNSNCKVMTDAPTELCEDICFKPAILPISRSSGAVIVRCTVSGFAPG